MEVVQLLYVMNILDFIISFADLLPAEEMVVIITLYNILFSKVHHQYLPHSRCDIDNSARGVPTSLSLRTLASR